MCRVKRSKPNVECITEKNPTNMKSLLCHAFTAAMFFCLMCASPVSGQPADGLSELPDFDSSGFTRIFDGKTLDDWDGDPTYWTVKDGGLVGMITPETLLKKNSWIIWRGGLVEDFELVVDYRVSGLGNSGIGYRLAVLEDDPYSVRGPQADIHGGLKFTGICYEENGRRLLAGRGQSTWVDDHGRLPRLVAQFGDPEELQGVVRPEKWNRYRLLVKGNDAKHFLNGVVMSEVHDHDETNRMHRGLVGVQVHVGPPMTIEFRNIWLKHLGSPPEGNAARGGVTYRIGSLVEPDHAPTFDNLANLAARMTAPTSAPAGDPELTIVTRDLGVVRQDLVDVELHGSVKPYDASRKQYDLIVMTADQTIRVPGEGLRIVGKRHDVPYRVQLKWSANRGAWTVVSLEAAEDSN